MSKQCTAALTFFVAKAYPYQITAHRPFMHEVCNFTVYNSAYKSCCGCREELSLGSTTQQSHLSYQHAATLVVAVIS